MDELAGHFHTLRYILRHPRKASAEGFFTGKPTTARIWLIASCLPAMLYSVYYSLISPDLGVRAALYFVSTPLVRLGFAKLDAYILAALLPDTKTKRSQSDRREKRAKSASVVNRYYEIVLYESTLLSLLSYLDRTLFISTFIYPYDISWGDFAASLMGGVISVAGFVWLYLAICPKYVSDRTSIIIKSVMFLMAGFLLEFGIYWGLQNMWRMIGVRI